MDGLLFLCFWLGGAVLHTLYDLKIKHMLNSEKRAEQSSLYIQLKNIVKGVKR